MNSTAKVNVKITKSNLEVYRGGQGEPMLILHGGKEVRGWKEFHKNLSAHFEVISPVHPGFSYSERPEWVETIEDLAYFYLDYLDQCELKDVHLVGMDIGGWIAAEMAIRSQGYIKNLILVNSLGIKISPPDVSDIVDTFVLPYDELMDKLWYDKKKGNQMFTDPAVMSEEDLEIFLQNQEAEVLYGWKPFMHNPQLSKHLHRIQVPTLVVWGEAGKIVDVEYGRTFAELIPNARFQVIKQAGHLPHLEQPDLFVKSIREFIET